MEKQLSSVVPFDTVIDARRVEQPPARDDRLLLSEATKVPVLHRPGSCWIKFRVTSRSSLCRARISTHWFNVTLGSRNFPRPASFIRKYKSISAVCDGVAVTERVVTAKCERNDKNQRSEGLPFHPKSRNWFLTMRQYHEMPSTKKLRLEFPWTKQCQMRKMCCCYTPIRAACRTTMDCRTTRKVWILTQQWKTVTLSR